MNILKLALIALTGLGFGFGTSQVLSNTEEETDTTNTENEYYGYGCHRYNDEFMEGYIEQFSEADQLLIQAYIDSLLLEYDVTIEDVYDDFDLHHELMDLIIEFTIEQELEPVEDSGYPYRHHMGGW